MRILQLERLCSRARRGAGSPLAPTASAERPPSPRQAVLDRVAGARAGARAAASASSRSQDETAALQAALARGRRRDRTASSCARPTRSTRSASAATRSSTRAGSASPRTRRCPTASTSGACGRSSTARSRASSTSGSCRTSRTARWCCRTPTRICVSRPRCSSRSASSSRRSGSSGSSPPPRCGSIERALPTLLAPNRDLGVMFQGASREGLVQYQFAFLNGNNDTTTTDSDVGDDKDVVARIFVHPFQETSHRGAAGSRARLRDDLRPAAGLARRDPSHRRPDAVPVPDRHVTLQGERARYSPQAYWFWGPFALLGEYVMNSTGSRTARRRCARAASAWQLAAACVLTGENTSWRGVMPEPSRSTSRRGGLGALEIVARYSAPATRRRPVPQRHVHQRRALSRGLDKEWAFGVNWYLNRFIKVGFNYEHTRLHERRRQLRQPRAKACS